MSNTFLQKINSNKDPRFDEVLQLENFGTTINFQTIFICNLNCYFCRGSIKNIDEISKIKDMTQNNFELFVKKATDYGINYIQITPQVGEPFLDKGIEQKMWIELIP